MTKVNQGILQAQFNVKNSIDVHNAFDSEYTGSPLLKSVEGVGEIVLTDTDSFAGFAANTSLEHLDPVKSTSQNAVDITDSLNNNPNLKYAKLGGNFNSDVAGKFDGNSSLQKVDLTQSITVKPEDFKGNNSLKELPKLDFSNPDLTDIITNATTLKPTTIDISNQDNTTCLGVHGDSTHQLGQLDGVKVSYNAPFNKATGPQIDVSYTDLNSNGLVNLFNTMPYNRGYETVGSPSIVDGVISGFSSANKVRISGFPNVSNYEIHMAFKSTLEQQQPIFSIDTGQTTFLRLATNGNLIFYIVFNYTLANAVALQSGADVIEANKDYIVKIKGQNRIHTMSLSSDGGQTWVTVDTLTGDYSLPSGTINFGSATYLYNTYYTGSIDLTKSYIKVQSQVSTGPVGYEVVGSPTITNGIVSGFSDSNYIRTSSLVPVVSNFEFNCKFTTGTALTGETYTLFARSNLRIGYTQEGYIGCRIPKNGTYAEFQLSNSIVLTTNTTYIEKVTYNGNSLTLSIYNANNQLISSQSWQDDGLQLENGQINIGRAGSSTFLKNGGLIDLNHTYIKVNGKLWFGHESALVPWFGPNTDKNLAPDGTLVGNPTIVNGLATDFTTEDYIKTSSISEIPTSFKMSTAFTANELALARLVCSNGSSSNYVGFTLTSNGEIRFGLRSSSGTQQYVNSSITYVAGTKYYVKAVRNDTTLSISVSTDGTNWTTDSTTVESGAYSLTKSFYVGVYYSSSTSIANPFNGTIDLKNTSIVSGTTQVYSGMVPMTKTLKITGATGTANLTSDEKAIVTNKGWTLQEN